VAAAAHTSDAGTCAKRLYVAEKNKTSDPEPRLNNRSMSLRVWEPAPIVGGEGVVQLGCSVAYYI